MVRRKSKKGEIANDNYKEEAEEEEREAANWKKDGEEDLMGENARACDSPSSSLSMNGH